MQVVFTGFFRPWLYDIWLDRFKVFGDGFTGLSVELENRLNRFYGLGHIGCCFGEAFLVFWLGWTV